MTTAPVTKRLSSDGERHLDAIAGIERRATNLRDVPIWSKVARTHAWVRFESAAGEDDGSRPDALASIFPGDDDTVHVAGVVPGKLNRWRAVANLDSLGLSDAGVLIDQPFATSGDADCQATLNAIKPISAGLFEFYGEYTAQWTLIAASSVITASPLVLLFVLTQRYIVAGITSGALKG